ncbi:DNA primase [Methylobacillus flagellatus]|uniref:DNA primase n=1 Tax=Methylobacillus flagellatus (strain ATCC 51484 / DSM 6875 / VKM B-1610 / KT) TaxID=265072 RepID=Q1GYU7_METFK|nr:DNA primase [Methylobacillus flagellatus]ABE50590.1 DNA primase [Methylobacillus flagellatus KT]
MIPDSFIQELLNRVDIVDVIDRSVPLKKAGANYSACCPFHNEKSPSFTVSPTKQFYHCFGCGAHGSAIGFVMEYQGISFVEAVHELAKSVGMIVPQESRPEDVVRAKVIPGLQEVMQQAADYYRAELKKSPRAIEYLKGRGLSGQVAGRFQIGYAPAGWQNLQAVFADYRHEVLQTAGLVIENEQGRCYDRFRDRIMFPIHGQKGQVIGFGGRVLESADAGAKYLNSPETPLFQKGQELYGLFLARRAIREAGRALVVEGYMDVVALAQYGIDYAVAALGTATTPAHIAKLMRQTDEIVFCFDGDSAGRGAAWRAAMNALPVLKDGLRLSFLFLPAQHDPDSYVREFGKQAFEDLMAQAMPLSQYLIQELSANNRLQSQEDKVQFLNEAEPILKQIQAPRLALLLRKRIAELADISSDEMRRMVKLPETNRQQTRSAPKQARVTMSLQRRFTLMAIMRPHLVQEGDQQWMTGSTDEDEMVRQVVKLALESPDAKPVAILHGLESVVNARLLPDLQRDLHLLDESLDFELEFDGVRRQLKDMYLQRQKASAVDRLKEKNLSQLTEEERELLKSIGTR